jgi:TolA-binding protein
MLSFKEIRSFFGEYLYSTFLIITIAGMSFYLFADKGIIYDPERGIIFSKDPPVSDRPSEPKSIPEKKITRSVPDQSVSAVSPSTRKEDLHINRKKDPPDVYFRSGLEYFSNGDFNNALKNFNYADSLSRSPLYKLWIAKALRRMEKHQQMIALLITITTDIDSSDVADDALLEMAIYYKSINDYEKSLQMLTRLIEQYPLVSPVPQGRSSLLWQEISVA